MKFSYSILILTSVLLGCSTSQTQLLSNNGETLADIWRKNGGQQSNHLHQVKIQLDSVRHLDEKSIDDNTHYTRTAANEATNLFPRLPNPDLTMYVFPHLTKSTEPVPVPGYTTVFPFYSKVQYAQPGERTRQY